MIRSYSTVLFWLGMTLSQARLRGACEASGAQSVRDKTNKEQK